MRILFDFKLTDLINKWSITNESLNYLQLSLLFLRIKNGQSSTVFKPVFFSARTDLSVISYLAKAFASAAFAKAFASAAFFGPGMDPVPGLLVNIFKFSLGSSLSPAR